jgi:hypothetical protein
MSKTSPSTREADRGLARRRLSREADQLAVQRHHHRLAIVT